MRTFQFDMRTQWRCLKRNQIIEREVQLFAATSLELHVCDEFSFFCCEFSDQVAMICGNFNRGHHYGWRNVDCKVAPHMESWNLIARIRTDGVFRNFSSRFLICDTFSMQTGFKTQLTPVWVWVPILIREMPAANEPAKCGKKSDSIRAAQQSASLTLIFELF